MLHMATSFTPAEIASVVLFAQFRSLCCKFRILVCCSLDQCLDLISMLRREPVDLGQCLFIYTMEGGKQEVKVACWYVYEQHYGCGDEKVRLLKNYFDCMVCDGVLRLTFVL